MAKLKIGKLIMPKEAYTTDNRVNKIELDDHQLCTLRKIIYKIYLKDSDIPTLNKLYLASINQLDYRGSKVLLRKLMKCKLGYKFKFCKNNGYLPMERIKLTCIRANYLRQIQQNRELGSNERPVIYLDELEIDPSNLSNLSKQFSETNEKYMLMSAAGKHGFIDEVKLFSGYSPAEDKNNKKRIKNKAKMFLNWLKTIIPKLPPNSIVVLDNALEHNALKEKVPDSLSPKSEMIKWLDSHNVEVNENLHRVELLQLIKNSKPNNNYVADELINNSGHTAMRMPIYCDLNPLENILQLIKDRIMENCMENSSNFLEVISAATKTVTKDDFAVEFDRVKEKDIEYWQNEVLWDDVTDNLDLCFDSAEEDYVSSSDDYDTDLSSDGDSSLSSSVSEDDSSDYCVCDTSD